MPHRLAALNVTTVLKVLSTYLNVHAQPPTPHLQAQQQAATYALFSLPRSDVERLSNGTEIQVMLDAPFQPPLGTDPEYTVRQHFEMQLTDMACLGYELDGLNACLESLLHDHPGCEHLRATRIGYRPVGLTPEGKVRIEAAFEPDYRDTPLGPCAALLSQVQAYQARGLPLPLGQGENVSLRDQLHALTQQGGSAQAQATYRLLVSAIDGGSLSAADLRQALRELHAAETAGQSGGGPLEAKPSAHTQ